MNINDIAKLLKENPNRDWLEYGNVSVQNQGDLYLFSYTREAMWENRWNDFEQLCRGLIINGRTGEIVARPFKKFFNWGQVYSQDGKQAYPNRGTHLVNVLEKCDGSLGILYRDGGYKVATRGSFNSEQAEFATAFLNTHLDLSGLPNELTLLFEIIYPENRIVVNYGDTEDLVLLAAINRFTGEEYPFYGEKSLYVLHEKYGFSLPQVYNFNNVTEILVAAAALEGSKAEGFVLVYSDGERFKIKGDEYLELHKIVSSLTRNTVFDAWSKGIQFDCPDEFKDEVDGYIREFECEYARIAQELDYVFNSAPKENRKNFALYLKNFKKYIQTLAFLKLDGRLTEEQIRAYCKGKDNG